jgi:hypothetical protein
MSRMNGSVGKRRLQQQLIEDCWTTGERALEDLVNALRCHAVEVGLNEVGALKETKRSSGGSNNEEW